MKSILTISSNIALPVTIAPPAQHVHVILNRYAKRSGIAFEQMEKAIRKQISVRIPNNYPEIARAINLGAPVPLDGRSEFTSALEQWARVILPPPRSTPRMRDQNITLSESWI